jgi:hypothetical protein
MYHDRQVPAGLGNDEDSGLERTPRASKALGATWGSVSMQQARVSTSLRTRCLSSPGDLVLLTQRGSGARRIIS